VRTNLPAINPSETNRSIEHVHAIPPENELSDHRRGKSNSGSLMRRGTDEEIQLVSALRWASHQFVIFLALRISGQNRMMSIQLFD